MEKFKKFMKNAIVKHGSMIAACAFAFVFIAANSSCVMPYYEPDEPSGLDKFKKFNR